MTCTTARELLVPRLDGELTPAEAQRVSEHVARCPACQREQDLHERVSAALDRVYAARPAVGHDVAGAARGRLESDRRRFRRVLLSVAATLLIAAGSWWLVASAYRGADQGTPDPLATAGPEVPADEELLENLDVLEAIEEEGVDLTPELVQVLLDTDSGFDDEELDQIFEYVLEEEVSSDRL